MKGLSQGRELLPEPADHRKWRPVHIGIHVLGVGPTLVGRGVGEQVGR